MSMVEEAINRVSAARVATEALVDETKELADTVSHLGRDGGGAELTLARRKMQEASYWLSQAIKPMKQQARVAMLAERQREIERLGAVSFPQDPGEMLDSRAEGNDDGQGTNTGRAQPEDHGRRGEDTAAKAAPDR